MSRVVSSNSVAPNHVRRRRQHVTRRLHGFPNAPRRLHEQRRDRTCPPQAAARLSPFPSVSQTLCVISANNAAINHARHRRQHVSRRPHSFPNAPASSLRTAWRSTTSAAGGSTSFIVFPSFSNAPRRLRTTPRPNAHRRRQHTSRLLRAPQTLRLREQGHDRARPPQAAARLSPFPSVSQTPASSANSTADSSTSLAVSTVFQTHPCHLCEQRRGQTRPPQAATRLASFP